MLMDHEVILNLDPIIHAPVRLAVLSILATVEKADFTFLRESTGTTDGNLSTHLSKLEEVGFIIIHKTFQGKKPRTICSITKKGREAFIHYFDELEKIVRAQKKSM
jgi:DNA-binding transcriptional ArsR family regulator